MILILNVFFLLKLKNFEMRNFGFCKYLFLVVRITICRRVGVFFFNRFGILNKIVIVYVIFFCNFLIVIFGVRG